ncbi:MAG TPA: AgmX/PglI C-terminal domain-containing protein, partial [Polyangiaceae bacterium]|nr:AgmX/PglI C-terminal domain-containing protein [Polyangiaceae bacterium]
TAQSAAVVASPDTPAGTLARVFQAMSRTSIQHVTLKVGAAQTEIPTTHLAPTTKDWLSFDLSRRALVFWDFEKGATSPPMSWTFGDAKAEAVARAALKRWCAEHTCELRVLMQSSSKLSEFGAALQRLSSLSADLPTLTLSFQAFEQPVEPAKGTSTTVISGRLPPELIQLIVRRSFAPFRRCYERGLAKNPKLEGRVSVRFVIDRDGKVTQVSDGGSSIPDPEVRECVLAAFRDLRFPAPDGGIVTVVYPIMLAVE